MKKYERLALIGCGLMGGSFALALRQAGVVTEVVGHSASPQTRQQALDLGVIDRACDSAAQAVCDADLVLLAVPVGATASILQAIGPALSPRALLMDVGSTKGDVVAAARAHLGQHLSCFVPAHPIAGKEKAGVEHAQADLYQGRLAILTPLPENTLSQISKAQQVWEAVGASVHTMTAEQHDATFAAVSHLPHLLAFAYMNGLLASTAGSEGLAFAGPGFRDFSRIAASDPAVWRDIFLDNSQQLLMQVGQLKTALHAFEQAIARADGQGLTQLIAQASQARRAWQGPETSPAPNTGS